MGPGRYWSNSVHSGGPSGSSAGDKSGMPAKSMRSRSGDGSRLSRAAVAGGGLRRLGWYL